MINTYKNFAAENKCLQEGRMREIRTSGLTRGSNGIGARRPLLSTLRVSIFHSRLNDSEFTAYGKPPSADSIRQKRFGPTAPLVWVKVNGAPVPTRVSTICQFTKSVVLQRR